MNDIEKQIVNVSNQIAPSQIFTIARKNKHKVIGTEAIFDFIARLKGIENLDLESLLERELDDICYNWYVRWKDEMIDGASGELLDYEEVLGQFKDIIPKVKFGKRDAYNRALSKAKTAYPPKEADVFSSKKYRLLISLCYWLQQGQKDTPFFLTGKLAGEACGISQNRGAHMLRELLSKKILLIAEKGTTHLAARYWYGFVPVSTVEDLQTSRNSNEEI